MDLVQSAWKKSGICPLNPGRFGEKDFAPSKLMSYAACLPPGYPELSDALDILAFAPGNEADGEGVRDEGGGENE